MKLYNTLTREIETVVPMNGTHLGLYACGPTVYDYAHLGHLRKYTMDDVLIRTLRHADFEVKFVQNITDVGHLTSDLDTGEDKLEKGARKYQQTVWEVAQQFEDYFFHSMDLMGNIRPDVSCRATDHIQRQLELVETLEQKGFTYVIPEDGVYFDTSKLPDYGKLARIKRSELLEGARVEMVPGKRLPTDFALWKFEKPGENRAMVWESPWAKRSFPGWHIECSAMSMEHLGEQFDIHTGGIDHIPVHHTNEIAQSEAATGKKPFVKYWVHHNFLRIDGEKMSKSLGNFYTIDDLVKRGASPQAMRLLFLSSHYRSELNFTWESLLGMQKSWTKLVQIVQRTHLELDSQPLADESEAQQLQKWQAQFFAAMENDLATPEAMSVFWQVAKATVNSQGKYRLLLEFDQVLGLGLARIDGTTVAIQKQTIDPSNLADEATKLLADRQRARDQKNWQAADAIRHQLEELGYTVTDRSDGTQQLLKTQSED